MMTPQLSSQQTAIIKTILDAIIPGKTVLVFGSRAKHTAKQYSDLDLAIDIGAVIPLELLSKLNEAFDESDLPFKVDLVDWHRIDDDFRQHITHYAITL